MLRAAPRLVLLTLAVSGCSSVEKLREEPDTTPQHPTAVMEVKVVNNGIKGLVPFEGTTKTWTRADMQRENESVKGTGTFTRFIVGTTEDATIARLDRKLVWTLDPKARTYTECPLQGCAVPAAEKAPEKKPEEAQKPADRSSAAQCKLKIASSTFSVKPSGEKKSINGFDTEQYQVAWLVTLTDPSARKTNSTLVVNVWTTPFTQPLKEAMAIEQAYAKNLAVNVARIVANDAKTRVVPEDAQKMIEGYMARYMTPADRAAFLKAGKELDKIKGYPILTELTWTLMGDACAAKEDTAAASSSGSSTPTSTGGVVSSVTSWFVKKKTDEKAREIADAAILSFIVEVKSHRVEPVNDSLFSPPKNYVLANPK
jgi:thiol-disulfide isomerase/thioredoxin